VTYKLESSFETFTDPALIVLPAHNTTDSIEPHGEDGIDTSPPTAAIEEELNGLKMELPPIANIGNKQIKRDQK
jgi:hypothetical protein